jgi:hypothetical protein
VKGGAFGRRVHSLEFGTLFEPPDQLNQQRLTCTARLEIVAGHGANQFIPATLRTDLPQPSAFAIPPSSFILFFSLTRSRTTANSPSSSASSSSTWPSLAAVG